MIDWNKPPEWIGWTYDGWGVPPEDAPTDYHDVGNIPVKRSLDPDDMMALGTERGRALGYGATLGSYGTVKQAAIRLEDAARLRDQPVTGTLVISGRGKFRLYLAKTEYGYSWRLVNEANKEEQ